MPGSNIEIRPAADDEMKTLWRRLAYAFANNAPPDPDSPPNPLRADQTLCGFDGERMVATSGAYEFQVRMNGGSTTADGVTVVSCDPGYRRQGIVRSLMEGLLSRSRSRDVPLSILWASMGAIYQRFGYGLATTHVTYDVPVRYVAFQFGDQPPGEVRLLDTTAARPHLESLYQQYAGPGNGLLHRGGFWDIFLQRVNGRHTHAAVYFDADDEPRGYCLYRTHWRDIGGPGPNHLVDVFDFVWLNMDAYRSLWLYLARHDLADRIRMSFVAEDDPAPNLFLEPRMLDRRTWDGVWLRVVDAGSVFSARGYDVSGETVIEVTGDELCPWNNDRYRIVTDGGETRVERGAAAEPDLVTGPEGLASLVTGHTRASDLHRMGRAVLGDPERGAVVDGMFATRRRPHCPNMF